MLTIHNNLPLWISLALIITASLSGIVFAWQGLNRFLNKNTKYLTTFAAGVFTVLTFHVLKETFTLSSTYLWAIGSIAVGMIFIRLVTYLLAPLHHHHSLPAEDCPHRHSCLDARKVMISDIFHNIGDGILLVSAYALDYHLGITATVGILLHEIVQEISEFFIYKEAGWSTKKALLLNFISATSIILGAVLALSLISVEWLVAPLTGLATGGFLYVLLRDLLPHTIHNARHYHAWKQHSLIFCLGVVLMIFLKFIAPHTHGHHEHPEHHEHQTQSAHLLKK